LLDSDNLITTGFSGFQATLAGAYDPNASNPSAIACNGGPTVTAICGTGDQAHVGRFLVKARCLHATGSPVLGSVRFAWKAGDGPLSHGAWVTFGQDGRFEELELASISIPAVTAGTQRWTGQVEMQAGTQTIYTDYLELIPQEQYGTARGAYSYTPGTLAGYDQFTGTTAGVALGVRTAPLGGAWTTSGDTGDFLFADSGTLEFLSRSTTADTGGRFAILGSTSYTDVEVSALVNYGATAAGNAKLAVVGRWTDSSNHLRLVASSGVFSGTARLGFLALEQVVAGSVTTLGTAIVGTVNKFTGTAGASYTLRLIAYATGRAIGQVIDTNGTVIFTIDAASTALATGGTLATGKIGLRDIGNTSAPTRTYDDFTVSTPAAEPIAIYSGKSMQWRFDDTIRQDSTGAFYGRPSSYRGTRFLLNPGTSRVLVKARRNDVDVNADDNVTDSVQAQVGWTPRGLVVPRT
jgi:hypothetical protein